jgi:hypothetical protein
MPLAVTDGGAFGGVGQLDEERLVGLEVEIAVDGDRDLLAGLALSN